MRMGLALFWLACLGRAWSLPPFEEGEGACAPLLLAAVPAGLDWARLTHLFDAAPARPPRASLPWVAQEPRGPRQAPLPAPQAPAKETGAYRRAFRVMLAHPEKTDRYDELILRESKAYGLDPRLLKAIIAAESEFSRTALSPRGAQGLMQVMPATAEEVGVPAGRLFEPEANMRAGASYLARLFAAAWKSYRLRGVRFQDGPLWVVERVIAAYNAGPRFLFRGRWWRETAHYVRKVMIYYRSRVTDLLRGPKAPSAGPEWGAWASGTLP